MRISGRCKGDGGEWRTDHLDLGVVSSLDLAATNKTLLIVISRVIWFVELGLVNAKHMGL